MEVSDFDDWMDAAEALIIHDEMRALQAANGGQKRFEKIQMEQRFLFGDNPFVLSEEEIKADQERRRAAWIKKKEEKKARMEAEKNGHNQNDNSQTQS